MAQPFATEHARQSVEGCDLAVARLPLRGQPRQPCPLAPPLELAASRQPVHGCGHVRRETPPRIVISKFLRDYGNREGQRLRCPRRAARPRPLPAARCPSDVLPVILKSHSILHRASNATRGLTPPRIVILKLRSRLSTPRAGMLRRPTFQPHDPMRANRPATARNLKPRGPTEEKSKRGSVHIPDSGNHLVPAIWTFQCHTTSLFLIHIQVCNRSLSHP